ncbi:hypothetical protein Asppvi_008039 [Aspergillus pseudoviridinutans]|uniref:Dickkopf N-terminal cysteine-rich domain-containing protein n=1 Tax=Aspergillus pseudoviridinutans TaxID=1517512 RepID=A0A9P3EXS8_9EURO|nr:uncharacterized protein Asppvi_008039 [Aspergillus pseudoviridinutans]GIJ89110.1 hypothetical protein Asppvi_008039 [Aspergillus pseudoviridinutans]
MKLHALIPCLLARLAASLALPEVNNGVINANNDATSAKGASENFATSADVTTLEASGHDLATRTCHTDNDCGLYALCINKRCVIGILPPELVKRDEETTFDTEGEPRHCNNINHWCPPHQFCYRGICVSIGALGVRTDEPVHPETRCRMNMDCPPSQSCVGGECRSRIPPVA